jgi:hypothetical protein
MRRREGAEQTEPSDVFPKQISSDISFSKKKSVLISSLVLNNGEFPEPSGDLCLGGV